MLNLNKKSDEIKKRKEKFLLDNEIQMMGEKIDELFECIGDPNKQESVELNKKTVINIEKGVKITITPVR